MGKLTTHVLDTAHGLPGAGISVRLVRVVGDERETLLESRTNDDGRCGEPVLSEKEFECGTYELSFDVKAYFSKFDDAAGDAPFLDIVTLRVTLSDDAHYHIPLLVSPWSYSTYRGS